MRILFVSKRVIGPEETPWARVVKPGRSTGLWLLENPIKVQKMMAQMPQQMLAHSQQPFTPLMIQPSQFQQQTNTPALPSPTTSHQSSQSHSTQQQNAKDNKVHTRNNSRNLSGNNNRQNKQRQNKKKHNNDRKNSISENHNQNNNVANNSKADVPDSNDAPGKVWNKQPNELNSSTWW